MAQWDIKPAGVKGVLTKAETDATSLSDAITSFGGDLESCAGAAINSSKIPVPDLMAGLLSVEAGWLKTDAANIRRHGSDIKTTWAGLSSCYSAPEAAELFAAMDPVATVSDSFAGDVEKVVSILQTFAEEAGPLVSTLQKAQADASAFGSKISGNDKWDHDKSLVDENNGYIHTVNTAVVAFQAAERKAANAIEALVGGQQWHVITDPNDKSSTGFGYASVPDDAKTPWGADVEKKDGCLKQTMKDGWHFAEGFGEGAWGAVKGIGALTGIEGWNAFQASWQGMENLALVVVPVAGVAVWGTKGYAEHAEALGKGLTDWDEWKKDPAKALGNVTFSVLTVAVPGAGGAGAVGKAGEVAEVSGDAAKASKLATAVDAAKTGVQTFTTLTDPFHYAAQLPKVADFATGLDLTSLPVLAKFGGADGSGLTNASKTLTADAKTATATAEREPALVGGRGSGSDGLDSHGHPDEPSTPHTTPPAATTATQRLPTRCGYPSGSPTNRSSHRSTTDPAPSAAPGDKPIDYGTKNPNELGRIGSTLTHQASWTVVSQTSFPNLSCVSPEPTDTSYRTSLRHWLPRSERPTDGIRIPGHGRPGVNRNMKLRVVRRSRNVVCWTFPGAGR